MWDVGCVTGVEGGRTTGGICERVVGWRCLCKDEV